MNSDNKPLSIAPKKNYSSPRVIEYGEVKKLTEKTRGSGDGMSTFRMA
jgi:hypothetical protein